MYTLTKNKIRSLIEKHQSPCISIYMPTHKKGREVEQNSIRFKNLIRKIENSLSEEDVRKAEIEKMLSPANELLENSNFWGYQSDGLAVFFSLDDFYYYRFPISFKERAVIAERCYIKPLIPLLSGDVQFFLLCLNLNDINLYQGTGYNLTEVQSDSIPKNIEVILQYEDPEKQLQFHTGTGAGKGRRAAMFHGHGAGKNDKNKKKNVLRFFQTVDKGVQNELADENSPLVLAGVDYLIPIYQEANSYPHLYEDAVDTNPANLDQRELHQKVWQLLQPHFQKDQEQALAQYHQLVSSDKASDDVREIIKAAHHNRIKYLFVDLNQEYYGKYDQENDTVKISEKNNGEDLTDLATIMTILHDGKVYALESERMPAKSPLAAVFRF